MKLTVFCGNYTVNVVSESDFIFQEGLNTLCYFDLVPYSAALSI